MRIFITFENQKIKGYEKYFKCIVVLAGLMTPLLSMNSSAQKVPKFSACIHCCTQARGPLPGESGDVDPECFVNCLENGANSISTCRPTCPQSSIWNKLCSSHLKVLP